MLPDLVSVLAEEILGEVRKLKGFDVRNAVYVDDINSGPVAGSRTWNFQVARPSVAPGGYSGGAYRQGVFARVALFASEAMDLRRESSAAQTRLGEKAVEIRQVLEGFYGAELNIPWFGMTGPSEVRVWKAKDATMGLFWVDWTLRAEKWDTLTAFATA